MPGLRITFKPCRPFFNTWSHVLSWDYAVQLLERRRRGKRPLVKNGSGYPASAKPKHGCIRANAEQWASHCFGEVGLGEPGALLALAQATATTALLIRPAQRTRLPKRIWRQPPRSRPPIGRAPRALPRQTTLTSPVEDGEWPPQGVASAAN